MTTKVQTIQEMFNDWLDGQLRAAGLKVFAIKNEEIDSMTNATLMGYLKTVWRAVADDVLYRVMYSAEKEYSMLR